MAWQKKEITLSDGTRIMAQQPVIISASRATDIPAFYGDWLIECIRQGYVEWKNPFNGVLSYVSFEQARLFIFWTKNPEPFIKHLSFFDKYHPNYYFQFTLNDYVTEGLEPGVPSLERRLDTFIRLSERVGKERVIWRFDPLLLTDTIHVDELLEKVERTGDILKDYTEKLVFSFADITSYRKVCINLQRNQVAYREFKENTMREFAAGLQLLNQRWGLQLATCAEAIDLAPYGIIHNKCVDDDLITRIFHRDNLLMDFLHMGDKKDKGQRKLCGCMASKDIGMYNSCSHMCLYCYANTSRVKDEKLIKKRDS